MSATGRFTVGLLLALTLEIAIARNGEKPAYIEELNCREGPFRILLPATVEALRKIGPLKNERLVETLEGVNNKSHITELQFEGLTLVILSDPPGHHYLLSTATITSPRWSITPNFKVGDSIVDVLHRLGVSRKVSPDQRKFAGDVDSIFFEVKGGRIQKITIDCYTG